jgi:hypothetical protein
VSEAVEAWSVVKDTTSVAALEAFIARYKNTYYADLAQLRIEELRKQQVAAATPPAHSEAETERLVRACDLVAASPDDLRRPADLPGIPFRRLEVRAAKVACQAALDASPKNPRVMFELGRVLDRGQEYEQARVLYEGAVAQGYVAAQAHLGFDYSLGRGGLAKDDREAVRLFKLSANQGDAFAQVTLGVFYATGRGGLTKDDREAVRLYKLAADQGNAAAQVNLGLFYESGRGGLLKDAREAARLYKLAADQGNEFAINALQRLTSQR